MEDIYSSDIFIFYFLQVIVRENVNDFLIYYPPTTNKNHTRSMPFFEGKKKPSEVLMFTSFLQ